MMPAKVERPVFPGNAASDLTPLPDESITSSLWRFAWRNGLRAKELLKYCSPYATYDKEHARLMHGFGFNASIFEQSSGWRGASDELKLVGATPLRHLNMWWADSLRYCPICLEHAYHSFWHQNLFIAHCPLDGALLSTQCHCCRTLLPAYGFHYRLLDRPYICPNCEGPIAGVEPSIEARLEIQIGFAQIKRQFLLMALWWEISRQAREEFESLFGQRDAYKYSPWLRTDASIRQWILDRAPRCSGLAMPTRTIPKLVILKWQVRLAPLDPVEGHAPRKRIPSDIQLDLARQVYKSTLRRLFRAIQAISPFADAEHRRYLALSPSDLLRQPARCNMYLLSLVVLRREYETYFSLLEDDISQARFAFELTKFGGEIEFGRRIRIYWRLRFLAEFGSIYWWLIALRNGNAKAVNGHLSSATLSMARIDTSVQDGDIASGSMAFPEVDGFDLRILARRVH